MDLLTRSIVSVSLQVAQWSLCTNTPQSVTVFDQGHFFVLTSAKTYVKRCSTCRFDPGQKKGGMVRRVFFTVIAAMYVIVVLYFKWFLQQVSKYVAVARVGLAKASQPLALQLT